MKKKTSILILLITVLLWAVSAQAAEVLEDNGSIRFIMDFDGNALTDGQLELYRVADLVLAEGRFRFDLVEELQTSGIALEDLQDPALPGQLRSAASETGLESVCAAIENGEAWFPELQTGLYVVFQSPEDAGAGYLPIDPFLITLPMEQDGSLTYQVEARPKVSPEPAPTDPTEPTEPVPPDIPQTGQLKWPVQLLAVLGMLLILIGWYLRFGGERERHET